MPPEFCAIPNYAVFVVTHCHYVGWHGQHQPRPDNLHIPPAHVGNSLLHWTHMEEDHKEGHLEDRRYLDITVSGS